MLDLNLIVEGPLKVLKVWLYLLEEAGFLDLVTVLEGKPLEGLSNGSSVTAAPPFSSSRAATEAKTTFGSVAVNGPASSVDKKMSSPKTNGDSQQPSASGLASSTACPGNAYHKQLAALNCSVRDWIVKHVNTNPLCDLTPSLKTMRNT